MEKGLMELLESAVLNEETKTALAEAWNNKLAEARDSLKEEVEAEVREEFSLRYDQDKSNLVEAMDRMLTDAVNKNVKESTEATRALKEERARLSAAITEARTEYKDRIASHTKMMETFVLNQLKEELKGITEDHVAIQAQRVKLAQEISENKAVYEQKLAEDLSKMQSFVLAKLSEKLNALAAQEKSLGEARVADAKKLREHRTSLNEQTAARINQLEGFVLEQLHKELRELETDKSNLQEARVRLVTESKQKLDETKKAFIARASTLVESAVEAQLKRELTQLKEDIKAARENLFGRRLFEAFHAEFMTSYLSEGSEVKKLNAQLTEAQAKNEQLANKLQEGITALETASRRVKIAEARENRAKTLSDLLSPLSKEKRNVMEELLESVKTPNLKEAFQKYLPTVLAESGKANQGRRALNEQATVKPKTVAVTGDRPNKLAESARAEEDKEVLQETAEILNLRRLAGLDN